MSDVLADELEEHHLPTGNDFSNSPLVLLFYQRYGVEEYYIYDPETLEFTGLLRSGENLEVIEEINGWVSPSLGVRFQITPGNLEIYRPDGRRFLTS